MNKAKQIVGINGYTLGVHACSIAEGDWKSLRLRHAPFKTGPLAALTKRNVAGKMKKPHSKCGSDLIGVLTALVPEWRNWQTR